LRPRGYRVAAKLAAAATGAPGPSGPARTQPCPTVEHPRSSAGPRHWRGRAAGDPAVLGVNRLNGWSRQRLNKDHWRLPCGSSSRSSSRTTSARS
jgi:hypothetical protein